MGVGGWSSGLHTYEASVSSTSPDPIFILCLWCKHSNSFLSTFWCTETIPAIYNHVSGGVWRKVRYKNFDLLFVFLSKLQKQLGGVKGWKKPVILWATDPIPIMETLRRLFCFCWSEARGERWSLCRASNLSWDIKPWGRASSLDSYHLLPWNREPLKPRSPVSLPWRDFGHMHGWRHLWAFSDFSVLHTVDVFVGLTPTLPLNLSLTPQLRPVLQGTLTSVSAEYWILLGKAMLWASGGRRGSYVDTAEDDFNTEFI